MRSPDDLNSVHHMVIDLTEALFPQDADVDLGSALQALADMAAVLITQASEGQDLNDEPANLCAAFMLRLVGQTERLHMQQPGTCH